MNFWIFWFITGLFKECCKQKSRAESSVLLWFFFLRSDKEGNAKRIKFYYVFFPN